MIDANESENASSRMNKLDEKTLKQIQSCDASALEVVVREHTSHIFKACLGLGFQEFEADEITQSVWLTFFDVAREFRGQSSVRTFLFGILYNKASEYRKRLGKIELEVDIEKHVEQNFDEHGAWVTARSPKSPDKFYEAVQVRGIIDKCLELLPLSQKMAFVMKEVSEDTTEEICNVLSVTATNLGVLLFRARSQLRECIERKMK